MSLILFLVSVSLLSIGLVLLVFYMGSKFVGMFKRETERDIRVNKILGGCSIVSFILAFLIFGWAMFLVVVS